MKETITDGDYKTNAKKPNHSTNSNILNIGGFVNFLVSIFIVDYVIVNELCHLVYHNHSRKFWKLLSTIIPDYAERKEWLKVNGNRLK